VAEPHFASRMSLTYTRHGCVWCKMSTKRAGGWVGGGPSSRPLAVIPPTRRGARIAPLLLSDWLFIPDSLNIRVLLIRLYEHFE
jgi:hypothetical protein